MRIGMVAQLVAAGGHFTGHAGASPDIFSTHEKRGANMILVESVEQSWRGFAGTVVEGERQNRPAAVAMIEGLAEDAGRASPHGVSHKPGRSGRSGGYADQSTIHT